MAGVQLNRRLVLESAERVADGAGGFAQSWGALGELWADVTLRSGRERASAGVQVSRAAFRIVVRGAPEGSTMRPRPDQRFREGARIYRIEAVAERDPEGRYLTCFATEEVVA
ncbi:head-tail adaptor protein [Thalassovita taeanensis]|uniref:Phage head-tail adaptor, putative, SPP1 family n=1 Tax=Thalassovita taeanensis TaxID=657014 RepID=A0A1H9HPY3_9RHOB|nr:head-tail adaptor protein [Thalassovita taeanensis]SEQ64390.1 phage head-tail adaptor, putative, SPP1 family [Thalassovita taeanensis]